MIKTFKIVLALIACAAIPAVHGQSAVPGAIQAEDYDSGANGVTYYDATPGNTGNAYRSDDVDIEGGTGANGHNVGWIDAGEWLEFTVNVTTSANYEVRYAVASQQPGPFSIQLSVDGQPKDSVTFNGTAGWQNWVNVTSPTPFALSNGIHTVRLDFLSTEFNVDEFEFSLVGGPVDTNVPPYLDPTNSVTVRVDDLMSRMSLDEKIGQMTQAEKGSVTPAGVASSYMGSVLSGGGGRPSNNATPTEWADMIDAYQAQALTTPLKIPILYGIDAVHGHNNVSGAVIFPHNIGLGATRNPELIRQTAEVTAAEVIATGAHWTFAPCIAVARNEAWGRTYESFAEIPELAAELGAAAIIGYQGTGLLASSNILATAKHFAGDGGTEGGDDQGNTILDEATFRELHVSPYIDAIEAGAKTIMVSYSSWNGVKMHGHQYMLTDVLKGEMGFEGFLISDWAGIDQIPGDYYGDVVQSINAGMDMVMVPYEYGNFISTLRSAVLANDVSTNRIDDAVRRILTVKFESGLFENPYAQRDLLADVGSAAHREVARQAVAESLVVLKDDPGLLPLSKSLSRIHLAGKNADNLENQCGGWSLGWQNFDNQTTTGTTIRQAIEDTVSGTTVTYSENGSGASGADVGIVVVGETPYAEGVGDTSNLFLSSSDLTAIDNVLNAGVPVIVVLVSGRPMFVESELSNWDALIAAWLPGTEGQGVADVLFGDTFPVGILSFSWPRNNAIPVNLGDTGYNPLFPYGFSIYVDGDIDADGLTDRWEALHGLDPYDDGSVNPDFGATGNPDGDVGDNLYEFNTGTHPQLAGSIFRITDVAVHSPVEIRVNTVPGYSYGIDYADMLGTSTVWNAFANPANGVGTWLETSNAETNFTFVDDFTPATSGGAPAGDSRFYRIHSTAP